jgi:hypothetical protein
MFLGAKRAGLATKNNWGARTYILASADRVQAVYARCVNTGLRWLAMEIDRKARKTYRSLQGSLLALQATQVFVARVVYYSQQRKVTGI